MSLNADLKRSTFSFVFIYVSSMSKLFIDILIQKIMVIMYKLAQKITLLNTLW